jgi:hypothetical protein
MHKILISKNLLDFDPCLYPQNLGLLSLVGKILRGKELGSLSARAANLAPSHSGDHFRAGLWKARSDVTLEVEKAVENSDFHGDYNVSGKQVAKFLRLGTVCVSQSF